MTPATPVPPKSSRRLTLADITDVRAYERERTERRADVLALKQRRRINLGTILAVAFENRVTMRHQIQEMARVEKLITDAALQEELDIYNPMIPEPGQLCATIFLELTNDDQMREWLPNLVGIERSLVFRLPGGSVVRSITEEAHESQLTREHVTAAVHYVRFELTPDEVADFDGQVMFGVDHPNYTEEIQLLPATLAELRTDLVA
jgi:hypothetical protein